jgi:hypothetical protein
LGNAVRRPEFMLKIFFIGQIKRANPKPQARLRLFGGGAALATTVGLSLRPQSSRQSSLPLTLIFLSRRFRRARNSSTQINPSASVLLYELSGKDKEL